MLQVRKEQSRYIYLLENYSETVFGEKQNHLPYGMQKLLLLEDYVMPKSNNSNLNVYIINKPKKSRYEGFIIVQTI